MWFFFWENANKKGTKYFWKVWSSSSSLTPVKRISTCAQSGDYNLNTRKRPRFPGTARCGQEGTAQQGSLASVTPSESTRAFISPRLVTVPHKCHLSFKWAPWQHDRQAALWAVVSHWQLCHFYLRTCLLHQSLVFHFSLNSLKWIEVELT